MHVRLAWSTLQQQLPRFENPADQAKLNEFVLYFSEYWIDGNQIPIDVWNQWFSRHLRTTNHAEGYHFSLNTNEIAEIRPALRNFLPSLQKSHHALQQHIRKLIAGVSQPKPREALYADLHQQIETEKQNFLMRVSIFGIYPILMKWRFFIKIMLLISFYGDVSSSIWVLFVIA